MAKSSDSWGRFQSAVESDSRNIIWSSEGEGGTGKTHFGLTAPEPIAVFLFDPAGLKGLMCQDAFKNKDIRVINYYEEFNIAGIRDKAERAAAAMDTYLKFVDDWETAKKKARTALWDKEDHVWEMLRYAHHEDFSAEPKSYYELNMMYKGWFTEAENCGLNLGVTRGMREKWGKIGVYRSGPKQGMPQFGGTGELIPRGQKEVRELVQVNLSHRWDGEQEAFVTTILEKCRLGNALELLGKEFENMTFLDLALALYPESDPDEWA